MPKFSAELVRMFAYSLRCSSFWGYLFWILNLALVITQQRNYNGDIRAPCYVFLKHVLRTVGSSDDKRRLGCLGVLGLGLGVEILVLLV